MSNPHENDWQAAAEAARAANQTGPPPPPTGPPPSPPPPAEPPPSGGRRRRFHSTRRPDPPKPKTRNPFLPEAPAVTEAVDAGDTLGPVMTSGPSAPTGAPVPGEPVLEVPARFATGGAYAGLVVQVCGLHGGAGTSTVAHLLGSEALDCGAGLLDLADPGTPVVLVARTHARGLHLVRRVAGQWASGGLEPVRLLGLVLVDDAPVLSKGLQREVKSVEGALPHCWRLAWSEDFRHDPELPEEAARGRLRRIRKSLLDQARKLPRNQAHGDNPTLKKGSA